MSACGHAPAEVSFRAALAVGAVPDLERHGGCTQRKESTALSELGDATNPGNRGMRNNDAANKAKEGDVG